MMQRKLAASKTKAFPYMNPSTARKSPRRRSLTNSSAAIKLEQHTLVEASDGNYLAFVGFSNAR